MGGLKNKMCSKCKTDGLVWDHGYHNAHPNLAWRLMDRETRVPHVCGQKVPQAVREVPKVAAVSVPSVDERAVSLDSELKAFIVSEIEKHVKNVARQEVLNTARSTAAGVVNEGAVPQSFPVMLTFMPPVEATLTDKRKQRG